jgi:hypothetical protein
VKLALRVLLLGGAAAVGLLLFRSSPRDLVLVYDLGGRQGADSGPDPVPAEVEVVVRRGDEVLRRAVLLPHGARQVRHALRLPDGAYLLRFRLSGPGGTRTLERPLAVEEDATVVLPLGP